MPTESYCAVFGCLPPLPHDLDAEIPLPRTHLVACEMCEGHGDLPTSSGDVTCRYCDGVGTVLVERPDSEGSPC